MIRFRFQLLLALVLALIPLVAEGAWWYVQPFKKRAIFCSEAPNACAMAAARMIAHTMTGKDIPEQTFRGLSQKYPGSYNPANGTTGLINPACILQNVGVEAHAASCDLDGLQALVARGNPVMAGMHFPGQSLGHAVVVDYICGPHGNRQVFMRDPKGYASGMDETEFCQGFTQNIVFCYGAACEAPSPNPPRKPELTAMNPAATNHIVINAGGAQRAFVINAGNQTVILDNVNITIRVGHTGTGRNPHSRPKLNPSRRDRPRKIGKSSSGARGGLH